MFKIEKLTFISTNNEPYDYSFNNGLNYFKSGNNTGKTEFYNLLDFMFGHKMILNEIECYKNCISQIHMEIHYNNCSYTLIRTSDINKNFIYLTNDSYDKSDVLSHEEYRVKLNKIFTLDENKLKELRDFANEDFSYRTFTMFNFLDENTQGKIQDFLSKCSQLEYSLKVNTILNFIFNKNLIEIKEKEQKLQQLQTKLKNMMEEKGKTTFILDKINKNLMIINPNAYYTGKNREEIIEIIENTKTMSSEISISKRKDIADLEVMYNSLFEQIKKYKNEMADMSEIRKYDINRKELLTLLNELIQEKSELEYLVYPIESLLEDLNEGISFGNYIRKDETVKKLEKQLEGIKQDLKVHDSRFELYSLPAKQKAIAVIEEYLSSDISFVDDEELEKIKRDISQLKKEIRTLQNSDDKTLIDDFSNYITSLYLSLKDKATFVYRDSEEKGFKIKYLKKGNVLQPVRLECDKETFEEVERNFYPGSMARHIIIQLCGYVAFLVKLLKANSYPIIPILVIDHISKPFDNMNCKAIGTVIFKLLQDVGENNMQVFMFDSEDSENLGIDKKYSTSLEIEGKTGLCPFFHKDK